MLGPERRRRDPGPTPATRSRSSSAPGRSAALAGLLRTLGLRRVAARHDGGPAGSDEGERVRAAHRPGARVDLRRGPVPRAGAARARGAAAGAARRGRRRRVLRRGLVRRPGQGGGFFIEQEMGTPGASYADRPALPHVSVPTTYSGAELTPFFGMTDPDDPAEERRGRTDARADRGDLRPGADAVDAGHGSAPRRA